MKCPTSTGVHARPTMYQEGVPRGAIIFLFLYVKCPLTPVPPPPPLQNMFRRLWVHGSCTHVAGATGTVSREVGLQS